jgi:transcriptional regulator with AAA-type ATPase domain
MVASQYAMTRHPPEPPDPPPAPSAHDTPVDGRDTIDQTWTAQQLRGQLAPVPGIAVVFTSGRAGLTVVPLLRGELVIGRGPLGAALIEDATVSRRHAHVAFDGERWQVTDLGSRNGTAVDGLLLGGAYRGVAPTVVRTGDTVCLPLPDVTPLMGGVIATARDAVVGPVSAAVRDQVARAAAVGMVHLRGESGTGKELLARHFHLSGARAGGPFVPVNCATIPAGVAERLLFGAKRGAYSGASEDADGLLQTADGGVLFLDEIAELELPVQAKLLRVLETGAVLPLGATRTKRVSLSLCSATHRDLRAEVQAGRFRADLWFRLGSPLVLVPPLRARREEIPTLIEQALIALGRRAHVSLVEACLLRAWPGNVRELLRALRDAALAEAEDDRVLSQHLPAGAGQTFDPSAAASAPGARAGGAVGEAGAPDRAVIEDALSARGGNIAATARALGVHRTQLRRWMTRLGIAGSRD